MPKVWSCNFDRFVDDIEAPHVDGPRILITLDTGEVIDLPQDFIEAITS